jgi:hypothetical protein
MSKLLFPMGGPSLEGRMESIKKEEESTKALDALGKELIAKKGKRDTAETPEEKAKLDKEIQAIEEKMALERESIEVEREARRRLMQGEETTIESARKGAEEARGKAQIEEQFGPDAMKEGRKLLAGLTPMAAEKRGLLPAGSMEGGATWKEGSQWREFMVQSNDPKTFKAIEDLLAEQAEQKEKEAEFNDQLAGDEEQRQEATDKIMKDDFKEMIDGIKNLPREQQKIMMQSSLAGSGLTGEEIQQLTQQAFSQDEEARSAAARRIEEVLTGQFGEISGDLAAQYQGYGINVRPTVRDFIYRGDGRSGDITPIDKADEFFGAKPGGALDSMGMGGNKTVNISINGGDEARVYSVVKKVLRDSGYGDVKRY